MTLAPVPSAPSRSELQARLAERSPSSVSLAVPVSVTGRPSPTVLASAGAVIVTTGAALALTVSVICALAARPPLSTASVTDSGGLGDSDSITLTVTPNLAPTVTIDAPPDGSSANEGLAVTLTGTATDPEEGDLSGSISWSSDQDGALGTGASVVDSSLSAGVHVITASVTDSGGLGASDTEDGDISASITWASSREGTLGTGASTTRGKHTITATVTDSGGAGASDAISIRVRKAQ